jgi:hypothetical protein
MDPATKGGFLRRFSIRLRRPQPVAPPSPDDSSDDDIPRVNRKNKHWVCLSLSFSLTNLFRCKHSHSFEMHTLITASLCSAVLCKNTSCVPASRREVHGQSSGLRLGQSLRLKCAVDQLGERETSFETVQLVTSVVRHLKMSLFRFFTKFLWELHACHLMSTGATRALTEAAEQQGRPLGDACSGWWRGTRSLQTSGAPRGRRHWP